MIEITTTGRTDLDDLFRLSGCLDGDQPHHPFLAFVSGEDRVDVHLYRSADRLVGAGLPAETPVMVQWPGRWTSDFFRMTIADVVRGLDEHRGRNACANCDRPLAGRRGYVPELDRARALEYPFCHACQAIIRARVAAGATLETIRFDRDRAGTRRR